MLFVKNHIQSIPVQTFIFVHDQQIILDYEKIGKFPQKLNYRYVFVGNKDTDDIKHLNPIVAKEYEPNLEKHTCLAAFSGWYVLWKHKLFDPNNHILLLEYDITLNESFYYYILGAIEDDALITGFVPRSLHYQLFVFTEKFIKVIREKEGVEIRKLVVEARNKGRFWATTNNVMFKCCIFDEFMSWIEDYIPVILKSGPCGVVTERATTFYALMKNIDVVLQRGHLKHEQLDSHKTQGIFDGTEYIRRLSRLSEKPPDRLV